MFDTLLLDRPGQTSSHELVIDLDRPHDRALTQGQMQTVDELERIWLVAPQEPFVQGSLRPAVVPTLAISSSPQTLAGFAVAVGAEMVALGAGLLPDFLGKSLAKSAIRRMGLKPIEKL